MAAFDMRSLAAVLPSSKIPESAPHSRQGQQWQMIDEPCAMQSLISTLFSQRWIGLDLEGVNLSRHGSISLIQIWAPSPGRTYIVDVHTLGARAFDIVDDNANSFRQALESEGITQYFFDVRNDADALYALFRVRLRGVVDMQLLELASRQGSKRSVRSRATCAHQERSLLTPTLQKWHINKDAGPRLFDSRIGGFYEVFNTRPLPDTVADYCIADVKILPELTEICQNRLNHSWFTEMLAEFQISNICCSKSF